MVFRSQEFLELLRRGKAAGALKAGKGGGGSGDGGGEWFRRKYPLSVLEPIDLAVPRRLCGRWVVNLLCLADSTGEPGLKLVSQLDLVICAKN